MQTCCRGIERSRATQKREDQLLKRSAIQDFVECLKAVRINWIRAIWSYKFNKFTPK